MRILHIILSLGKGGAEKLLVDVLPRYVGRGYDVSILQLSSIKQSLEYLSVIEKAGINLFTLSNGQFRNPFLILKLRRFLKSNDYDVVHVHLFPGIYWTVLATRFYKNRPVLVFTEHSSQNGRNTKFFMRPIERYMYSKYDAILAISQRIYDKLSNWINLDHKMHLVHNGVDLKRIASIEPYRDSFFIDKYNLESNSYCLLMVARFSHPKDHLTVIRSMNLLPQRIHVFFVGDGDRIPLIKKYAEELGLKSRVHFMGFRTDVVELMKSADLIILSSHYEGMSGVTLEALASETPFLGSDVFGINELVPDKRFLFESKNHDQLAEKILEIEHNSGLAESMKIEGANHIGKYNVDKMINEHVLIYKQLLNNN